MKSFTHTLWLVLLAVAFGTTLHAQSIEFGTTSSSGAPGDIVTSTVVARDFGDPGSYQWAISWDRSQASYSDITLVHPPLAPIDMGDFGVSLADTALGEIRVLYSGFASRVDLGTFTEMFTLELKLEQAGSTTVTFGPLPGFPVEYFGDPSRPTITNSWMLTVTGPGGTGGATPCDGLTGPSVLFADTSVVSGNNVCLPVYASELDPLTSFNFTLDYDAAALGNPTLANVFAGLLADLSLNSTTGEISYSNASSADVAIPACQIIFDVCFDASGPTAITTVTLDAAQPFAFASTSGPYSGVTAVGGDVSITNIPTGPITACDGITVPTVVFGDTTVVDGMRGCVPVYASNLNPLTAFDFNILFDAAKITNIDTANVFAPIRDDLTFDVSTGGILYFNGGGMDVAIPECTLLFDLCFDAAGGASTTTIDINSAVASEFAQVSGVYPNVQTESSTVTITSSGGGGPATPCDGFTDPTIVFGDTMGISGTTICVPVYASNMPSLTAFSFPISFDASALSNFSIANIYAPLSPDPANPTVLINPTEGNVSYFNSGGADVAIPECQLIFDICFDAIGGTSTTTIDFDLMPPSGVDLPEFASNANGVYTPLNSQAGTIQITNSTMPVTPCDGFAGPGLVFGDTVVTSGARGCTPVYGVGIDPIAAFNFTLDFDATVLTNLTLENIFAPFSADIQFAPATGDVLFFSATDIAVPECQLLFDVCYDAVGPSTTTVLDLDTDEDFEFAQTSGVYPGITSQAGNVVVNGGTVPTTPCDGLTDPTVVFGDAMGATGTNFCVPVYAANMPLLTAFSFPIEFDNTALSNFSIANIYAPLSPDPANPTVLINMTEGNVSYFNTAGSDIAIPECQLLFEICFDAIGGPSTTMIGLDFTPPSGVSSPEFASVTNGVYTPLGSSNGTITITDSIPAPCDDFTGPTVYVQVDSGDVNDIVCLAVIGYQLGDVGDFTIDFAATNTIATFQDTANVNAAIRDGLTIDAANGQVSFSAGMGAIPNLDACDTLMQVCYTLIGSPEDSTGVTVAATSTFTNSAGSLTPAIVSGGLKIKAALVSCDPIVITNTVTFPTCNGDADGQIDISVSGGDGASYSYSWDDGNTNQDRSGLSAGNYTVTVTSCGGSETASATIIVGQPDAVTGTAVVTNVRCNGESNGAIDLMPQGGTAPYTYVWTGAGTTPGFQDQNGLGAGSYSVTITDANDCVGTASFNITQPAALALTSSVTQPSGGLSNGAIDITLAGGVTPYTFAWTGMGVVSADEDQVGLLPGTYGVTVTDVNGCTTTASFTLVEGAPGLTATSTPSCADSNTGTIDLELAGGTPPFTFVWDNGLPAQEDQSNVAAGTYTVTVTDANGLMATTMVTVGTQPAVILTASVTPSSGLADGAIDLTATGGSGAGYTYVWSTTETSQDISGLVAGQYTVTVTDIGTTCTFTGTYDVTIDVQPLSVTTAVTPVSCNSANGGSCNGTFTLQINAAIFPVTVTFTGGPAIGLPASQTYTAITNETFTGLCPGSFDLFVEDAVGANYTEANITVTEPTPIVITNSTIFPVVGTGTATGGVSITVAGGTSPYTYQWSSGSVNKDLAGVGTGNYTVTITDANGCELVSSPFAVQEFRIVSAMITDVFCLSDDNGAINIEVTGATGPFTYLWSNGATTQDISGINGGMYTVTVTDVPSGRTITATYAVEAQSSITVNAQVNVNFNGEQVSCAGSSDGSAFAVVSGGVGSVSLLWSTGATTPMVSGLSAGQYTVTATDELNCVSAFNVFVDEPDPIAAQLSVIDIRCAGSQATGSITASATGGTLTNNGGGYDYIWSNGVVGTPQVSRLPAGSYTVTIIDDNGCSRDFTAGVIQPDPITVDFNVTDVDGNTPGSIELLPMGGTAPYTYNWQGRTDTTRILDNLVFGTYVVTVTDENNCEPVVLEIEVGNRQFDCFRASNVLTPGASPGLNDFFEINCIQNFPENSVEIYDRWGREVFNGTGYDNTTVVFDGFKDGQVLTEGGYFYVLRYRDANNDQQLLKGSLNILR